MFRLMATMVLLAVSMPAVANVEIFFTNSADPYGLTRAANAFEPTKGLRTDVTSGEYVLAAAPPMNVSTPTINYAAGEFAYIWLRFVNEIPGMRLQWCRIQLDATPADVAWYIVDDTAGTIRLKRWDGSYTPPNFLEFKNADQGLVAVTAAGLKNLHASNWNLYDGPTRTYLIGAVRYDVSGTFSGNGEGWNAAPPPNGTIYPFDPFGSAIWIPEPATLTLACTLAAILRRRRRLARALLPNSASARASGEP
ncbi:MAG: hypothetical protein AB1716_12155 [Planctomycetota bacterium]